MNAVASLRRIVLRAGDARAKGKAREDAAVLLSILDEEAQRIGCIVSDLLDFARPMMLRTRWYSLDGIFVEVQQAAAVRPEAARTALLFEGAETVPQIEIDPRLLRQALYNLVLNGLQAMPSGGTLAVRARFCDRSRVLIEVSDTGTGLGGDRARIFEPFFTTKPTGTGLGLTLVKRVVEAHGGEVTVVSNDAGSTFTISLPAFERKSSRMRNAFVGQTAPS
jgi:signal transduction histidine kinase